ncbi:MAG: right-handed parallel beta-helix repeat-containing protein [Candidatus Hydrogenedentota bacterium]
MKLSVFIVSLFVSFSAYSLEFHVSPAGPITTITESRDAIRAWRAEKNLPSGVPEDGFKVTVHAGTYVLDETIAFTEADSGVREMPIEYRAADGETVRLLGGKLVANFERVTDKTILSQLDVSAREHVVQANLRELGIDDFGSPKGGGLELFFDGNPMMVSRWPNEGFTHIVDIVVDDGHAIHGNKGTKVPQIKFDSDRGERWAEENDLWAHGYWFWDWSEQRMPVKAIDVAKSEMTFGEPAHGYGYRKGQWFYVFNALCELDRPGEWYLDRDAGLLYFWPPKPVEQCETFVSSIETALTMTDASHIRFTGMTIEGVRGTAVNISGGEDNWIVGCTLQNIGAGAITVTGGKQHGVIGCDIAQTGRGGISLSGGDRVTLVAAGHFAENNHIHHYARLKRTYQSGIQISGVGNRATRNLIHNAPHMAIGFGGNDHVIEGNEIHSVCYESNDAGAIYTGRNWTMRGHIIRDNYMHDVTGFENKGSVGVSLDDMFSSAEITGNLFVNVTRAAFIGGGRDCLIENNLFVDCKRALHIDARALGWAHQHADDWLAEVAEKGTISGMAYDKPPYSLRYPALAKILEGEPKAPEGNIIRRNVFWGGDWKDIEGKAEPFLTLVNNLTDTDPLLVDAVKKDYRLGKDSPAFGIGFKPLAMDKMGLYESNTRASWPVLHEVRN